MRPDKWLLLIIFLAFGLRVIELNSLPVTLNHDEATNGRDALMLYQLPSITLFLENNFGRETLFFYLQGLMLKVAGASIFSLRFISIFFGVLSIPLLYVASKQLNPRELISDQINVVNARQNNTIMVSLLATAGLAISYWHIYFSRLALRAILLLPITLLCIWAFWKGWHDNEQKRMARWWLIFSGALLGLSAYIYLAARLLPLLFAIFVFTEIIRPKVDRIRKTTDFFVFGFMATLVAGPLLIFFKQNPQNLFSRTQMISVWNRQEPAQILVDNIINIATVLFLSQTWLGQWPALNLLSSLGLITGILVSLYHFKKPLSVFLLLWAGIGFIPVLFSEQNWQAQTTILRGVIAWPAIFLISGLGLVFFGRWSAKAITTIYPNVQYRLPSFNLLLAIFVIGGGINSGYNYFHVWTNNQSANNNPSRLVEYIKTHSDQLMLIPAGYYTQQTADFLLHPYYFPLVNGNENTLSSLLTPNISGSYMLAEGSKGESLFVLLEPAIEGKGNAYLLPPLTLSQVDMLYNYTETRSSQSTLINNEQKTFAQLYPLLSDAPFLPQTPQSLNPVKINFDHQIFLTGYQVQPNIVASGETVSLYLNWQSQTAPHSVYHLFIHLFNLQNEQRVGQFNVPLTGLLAKANWPVGLTVPDAHHFRIPDDAPEGVYRFEIGLYNPGTEQRVPIINEHNQQSDDKFVFGKLHVQNQPASSPQISLTDIEFDKGITLIGIDLRPQPLNPGGTFSYALHWQPLQAVEQSYIIFTHLLDPNGNIIAQQDNIPVQGKYPTNWWSAEELIVDPYTLTLPANLSVGEYTLRIGLYLPETGQRLSLKDYSQSFVDLVVPQFQ